MHALRQAHPVHPAQPRIQEQQLGRAVGKQQIQGIATEVHPRHFFELTPAPPKLDRKAKKAAEGAASKPKRKPKAKSAPGGEGDQA